MEVKDLKTEEDLLKEEGFTKEDKDEIYKQIEKMARKNRIKISPDTFKIHAEKGGAFFPIIVNIIAVGVIAASFFTIRWYFDQRVSKVTLETQTYFTAERQLISEILRDSEAKLQAKQSEINSIQDELFTLSSQQDQLRDQMEESIRQKETELQGELQRQLAVERARLKSQGISNEDLDAMLAEWEDAKKQDLEFVMEDFRSQAAGELEAKEAELGAIREDLESVLGTAEAQRAELAKVTEERRAEREALIAKTSEVEQQLTNLTTQRDQENLIMDQIIGTYDGIQLAMQSGNKEDAQSGIEQLQTILDNVAGQDLPLIEKRLQTEKFLIGALETLLQEPGSLDTGELALLDDLTAIVDRAKALSEEGQSIEAMALYNQALNTVPAIAEAYNGMKTIEGQAQRAEIEQRISDVRAGLEDKEPDQALQDYLGLVEDFFPGEEQGSVVSQGIEGAYQAQLTKELSDRPIDQEALAKLNSQLDERDKTISSLQQDVEAGKTVITNLNQQLEERRAMVASLEGYKSEIQKLRSDFVKVSQDLDASIAANDADAFQKSLAQFDRVFSSTRGQEILPGIDESFLNVLAFVEERVRADAIDNASTNTMDTTVDVARYLSGVAELSPEEEEAMKERIERDETFSNLVEELQDLAARGQVTKDLKKKSYYLLGVVSYSLGDSIIIERLTDLLVSEGQNIQFKRQQGSETSEFVAEGIIENFQGSKILAQMQKGEDGSKEPRAGDIVYLERIETIEE